MMQSLMDLLCTSGGQLDDEMSLYEPFVLALKSKAEACSAVDGDADLMGADAATLEALKFVQANAEDVSKALQGFKADGTNKLGAPMPASAFNDFYKWTMTPVMRATERAYGDDVRCTFSVNIRDVAYRNSLYESATGKADPHLLDMLSTYLKGLADRKFDRDVFERCVTDNELPGWDASTLDYVCGGKDAPRSLVDEVVIDATSSTPKEPSNKGDVIVQLFVARDSKLEQDRVYIEASGPWSRVTWLETSMMQATYEALFRHSMRKRYEAKAGPSGEWDDSTWYPQWLADALIRCVRSTAAADKSGLAGALFTGRRTGGMALMVLQVMYLQSSSFAEKSKYLGTSSVTAHYRLKDAGVQEKLIGKVSGTHAHELSMVLAAVLGEVDDKVGAPLSQLIGHTLYFYCSRPQGDVQGARKALMPMLPDTLGTDVFMKIAKKLNVPSGPHKDSPLLSVIGAARQDSGTLADFLKLMQDFDYKGALMASEIEKADDLFESGNLGYKLFGAGGFMGDSEHAWNPSVKNISMAVKVLRVHVKGELRKQYCPVKTGDDKTGSKFEADGLLSDAELAAAKQRTNMLKEVKLKLSDSELQDLFQKTVMGIVEG